MSQQEPRIFQVSAPGQRRPTSERELRQAYKTATVQEEESRARGARERLHSLGTAMAVCCGLMLNVPLLAQGAEIGVEAVKGLSGLH